MTPTECDREQDVLDAVASRRWPDRAGAELHAHVARCGICADLVEVSLALGDAQARACLDARVPAAGLVWWRAGLRARHDAARAAARPLLLAQLMAWACAAAGVIALAARARPQIDWAEWAATIHASLPLALVAGLWLILAPIALYLACSDE